MNTNPNAIKVLCYGDSNTWGYIPGTGKRYPADVRWTGVLQKLLGDGYEIIEEGMCGRTTNVDDPKEKGRNGATYLLSCIESQNPIDVFILMLGTNDFKDRLNHSIEQIAEGIEQLVQIVKQLTQGTGRGKTKIIIMSPPRAPNDPDMSQAAEKSEGLAKELESVAKKNNCEFIDLKDYVSPSQIDCHLNVESHKIVGNLLVKIIKEFSL